jgi:hypothetical protein
MHPFILNKKHFEVIICRRSLLFFSILLISALSIKAEYSPNLQLSDDLNQLLLRLSITTKTSLPTSFYAQPMSVHDVETFFKQTEAVGLLSRQELFQIEQFRKYLKSPKYLQWSDQKRDMSIYGHFDGLFNIDQKYSDSSTVRLQGKLSPLLTGNIGKISYYAGIDVWTDHWTDTMFQTSSYQPYEGVPYNLYGRADSSHTRSSDLVRGGLRYSGIGYSLEIAIDYFRYGPAVYYPLMFSGYAPPLTYARLNLDLGPFKYSHSVGQLKNQKDKPKFFYTHRYQCSLWKDHLVFGLNEVIVNGSTTDQQDSLGPNALRRDYYGVERKMEWAYIIPIIPMKFTEHYNGDRDNGLMSFDADLHLPHNFRCYIEFLMDDMTSPWTIFTDDWGNKWAVTAGTQWFGTFKRHDLAATIEYSRVEPWVYTHFYGGSHRYDHFNVPLGNPLGPNSDALNMVFEIFLNPQNTIGLSFVNTRWNHSTRGGNITDVFQDSSSTDTARIPDSEHKTFLGKGTERSTRIGLVWKYSPFGVINWEVAADYDVAPGRGEIATHLRGNLNY